MSANVFFDPMMNNNFANVYFSKFLTFTFTNTINTADLEAKIADTIWIEHKHRPV